MADRNRTSVPPIPPDRNRPPQPWRPATGGGLFAASTANAQLVYILYLLGFVLGGLSNIVGVIIAYLYKNEAEAWLKTHYHYQIRTFWLGLLYGIVWSVLMIISYSDVSGVLIVVFVGFILTILFALWLILRCVKGLTQLQKGERIDDVTTWLV
jgi:uncharacterized membrane protein